MFDKKIVDFFKNHNLYDEEMFRYISLNCDMVDYYDDAVNFCVGCPPKLDKRTNKIIGLRLCIPYCINEVTRLVAVHEISHAIYWYKKMGQKHNRLEEELFPMIVERIYVEENKTPLLENYEKDLDGIIDEKSPDRYRFALKHRDEMLDTNISDIKKFDKSMRKLSKKWKRENK